VLFWEQIVPAMTSISASHPAPPPAASGATHQPYVPPTQAPAELTLRAIVLGVLLGLIFGASNVYLALKIGLTVSASIPIAVLSITIFRWLGRSTILENNIVQTTGSAADSVSAGVVFTIPAILLMGYDLDIGRVTVLAIAGGLMGVLMMIPLRRALIVKEHGNLVFPEGTACAKVLVAGGAIAGIAVAALAAVFAKQAEAAQVPAADYLAHLAGLQQMVGPIAESDLFALLIFFGLGAVLYRVANR
jgi:putative OPT family oligopeptide transporter